MASATTALSTRLKSCRACVQGKRKCDRTRPSCRRCQLIGRKCRYDQDSRDRVAKGEQPVVNGVVEVEVNALQLRRHPSEASDLSSSEASDITSALSGPDSTAGLDLTPLASRWKLYANLPDLAGSLGDIQNAEGMASWKWVFRQLQSQPLAFIRGTQNEFIHRRVYNGTLPVPLRMAYGICTTFLTQAHSNKVVNSDIMDAEITELLLSPHTESMLVSLARLQALALYQSIRFTHGSRREQDLAAQQKPILESMALQLLKRAQQESDKPARTWQDWLVAESTRRTVLVIFMLHAIHSIIKYGSCLELPTLALLPVSPAGRCWGVVAVEGEPCDERIMTYSDYTTLWFTSPMRRLESFEKMLLVACKGLDKVEALSLPDVTS